MPDSPRTCLFMSSCLGQEADVNLPISMKATKACCFHRCCTAASEMRGNEWGTMSKSRRHGAQERLYESNHDTCRSCVEDGQSM
jgi:hypothetical protein